MNLNDPHLLEKLAALEHDRWAHWMEYLFACCRWADGPRRFEATIPAEKVNHWQRQIDTKYADLSEKEKESDRVEARKTLALFVEEKNKFPLGCLLPDGHEGPCVEAKWEPEGEIWLVAKPTPEWSLNVDISERNPSNFAVVKPSFFWSITRDDEDAITGYASTADGAKAKAEAVLRALLSVPGGL